MHIDIFFMLKYYPVRNRIATQIYRYASPQTDHLYYKGGPFAFPWSCTTYLRRAKLHQILNVLGCNETTEDRGLVTAVPTRNFVFIRIFQIPNSSKQETVTVHAYINNLQCYYSHVSEGNQFQPQPRCERFPYGWICDLQSEFLSKTNSRNFNIRF